VKLSHLVTIVVVVSILLGIAVSLGVYFFVYKKVVKSPQTKGVVNATMETVKNAKQAAANEERLYAVGQDAEAIILEVHDAGFATKRYTQLILVLDVMPAGGKAFQVRTKKMISQSHAFLFQPGAKLKVKYDPAHPDQIALVSSPVPASVAPKGPSQRLEELDTLKGKGLINEDEYRRKRQEILKDL